LFQTSLYFTRKFSNNQAEKNTR